MPKLTFPGGALIGCDRGFLNFAKIKGSHTAIKSGMLAAESVADALFAEKDGTEELTSYVDAFKKSWLYDELFASRNFGPAIHKFGAIVGGAPTALITTITALTTPAAVALGVATPA